MEKIIHTLFDIKNTDNKNFPFINISFKNSKNEQISINLKDYISTNNFHHINMEYLEPKFFANDLIKIKCNFNDNIKIYCIDPFFQSEIYNNIWSEIGITNQRGGKNYFLLKTYINNKNHIILVSFRVLEKKFIIRDNCPINIQLYLENNNQMKEFTKNFERNLSQILDIPEDRITNVKIEVQLLISCNFIILPIIGKNCSSNICYKILDFYNLNKTIKKYKDETLMHINDKYKIIINNIVHIEYIYFYSNKLFQGIQIKSDEFDIYNSNIHMCYENKKNIIKIKNKSNFRILIQSQNKDYDIEYNSNLKNIILDKNIFFVNPEKDFNIDVIIKKKIDNILLPNSFDNIQISEINRFELYFKFIQNKSIFDTKKNLFSNFEIDKIKIVLISIFIGIFSGIIYSKLKENNEENDIFLPKGNINRKNIDNNFFEQCINDMKYSKYNLEKDFFDEKNLDENDIQIIQKLGILKKKKINKNK